MSADAESPTPEEHRTMTGLRPAEFEALMETGIDWVVHELPACTEGWQRRMDALAPALTAFGLSILMSRMLRLAASASLVAAVRWADLESTDTPELHDATRQHFCDGLAAELTYALQQSGVQNLVVALKVRHTAPPAPESERDA